MNREISRLTKRMRLGRPIESYPVTITSSAIDGRQVQFCTNLDLDPVQRKHRKGVFYEALELAALAAQFPKGGTFVDIGAHTGNHSLFAALFMDAGKIIPIEPNPRTYRLLIQNMLVNGVVDLVDFTKLGCAAGAAHAEGAKMKSSRKNPAAARLKSKGGDITICRADVLLAGVSPDAIKIDVSGMELDVLNGLADVFVRCAPMLLVEVSAANDDAFNSWAKTAGYDVVATTKRNKRDLNYMMVHKGTAKPKPKAATSKRATAAKTTTVKKKATAKKPTTPKAKTTAAKTTKPKTTRTTGTTKARTAATQTG